MAAAKKADFINYEKNWETISNFLLPFVMIIYLGIVLKKYSLEAYTDLVTNEYLLLGFKDVEALRKHLVDNMIGSAVWGLSFMYIRKMANPGLQTLPKGGSPQETELQFEGKMDRVLEQKLKKVVDGRTDTPAMLEALQAIAVFYGQQGGNTAEARKSLRQDLEKQNMVLCDRFLDLFSVLRKRLDALDLHTASLEGHCQSIHSRIDAAEESMSAFLQRARALQKQQGEVEERASQITAFLQKFILSDAEVSSLRYDAIERVTEQGERPFFAALRRVQEIRLGCSKLVGSKHQTAGFEMLEALSEHQEAAFRRLHSWILQRCAGLERDEAADVEENDVPLGLGLKTMRERPALFVHCQECLMQRRKDVIRRRFLIALTQGVAGRPIEMQAHDPVRYLSDILAWLHQTIASEREFLYNLGGEPSSPAANENLLEGREGDELVSSNQKELSSAEILSGTMDGIAPLLKARIMQLLDPANGLVLSFRLLNLIAFYDVTMEKLDLADSALGQVLAEGRGQCQRIFEVGLRHFGESALASPPAYTMDLSAAALTSDAGRQLAEILEVHEASLIPTDCLGYALDDILTALIEPILRACRLGAEGLDPSDAAVYMLNNAAALQSCLSTHSAGADWAKKLGEEMETWLGLLVRYQSDAVLERSGLGPLLERAQAVMAAASSSSAAPPPLVDQGGLDQATVAQVMRGFYSGLFALPQFERLQNPTVRARARQKTSSIIAAVHEKAHELFDKAESGYRDRSFLLHTPEQVKILLDCDE